MNDLYREYRSVFYKHIQSLINHRSWNILYYQYISIYKIIESLINRSLEQYLNGNFIETISFFFFDVIPMII